jgi:nitrile hydratase accessory protein
MTQHTPDVHGLPRDAEGNPVFREPWQAQAFAMAVDLHARGYFTWSEWSATLAREIQRAQAAGDPDLGDTYYLHWITALEHLVADKGLIAEDELAQRKADWADAARNTPHGRPIELSPQ